MNSLTIASTALDADDFAVLLHALDVLEQKTADELEKFASNTGEAALLTYLRSQLMLVRSKLDAIQVGGHMNAASQIAEARASAISLRATAKACKGEQAALKFRLTRAAESLDATALLAMRGIERVEQFEQELRELTRNALTEADGTQLAPLERLLRRAVNHARTAFDSGGQVHAGELLAWFTEWREEVQNALHELAARKQGAAS